MSTENGLQPISPLRRLSILSLRSRNSVHISQEELILLDDCKRMVKEVHRNVAAFKDLLLSIGHGERDSPELRDDLRRLRRKCIDLCRKAKTRMLPTIRSSTPEQNEQLYKYFYQLVSCLQIFISEMEKLYQLSISFPKQLNRDDSEIEIVKEKENEENQIERPPVPEICVGGEKIQISISDPCNEDVPYEDEHEFEEPPFWIDAAENVDPEIGKIRRETQEARDLFCDIDDLMPKTTLCTDELLLEEPLPGRKVKTKIRKPKSHPHLMCCSCKPNYL